MASAPFLSFEGLVVHRGERPALNGLTLSLRSGESVAIIGPNGCGKSTLVKAISRECYPWEGTVKVFGRDGWDVFELRNRLGIVTQDVQRAAEQNVSGRDIPGLEVVLSGFFSSVGVWEPERVTPDMVSRANTALRELDALHLAERPLCEMSSGEARRVLLARALAHGPQALLLDEPTNSLDLRALDDFLNILRRIVRKGTDLVLVTHHLHDVIPEISRVVLIRDGRVFREGPKREVLTSSTLTDLFGFPVRVTERRGWFAAQSDPS